MFEIRSNQLFILMPESGLEWLPLYQWRGVAYAQRSVREGPVSMWVSRKGLVTDPDLLRELCFLAYDWALETGYITD